MKHTHLGFAGVFAAAAIACCAAGLRTRRVNALDKSSG